MWDKYFCIHKKKSIKQIGRKEKVKFMNYEKVEWYMGGNF